MCFSPRPPRQATLQVAGGDRTKAVKMLEDPDALMANPEINRIIAAGAEESSLEVVEGQYSEEAAAAAVGAAAVGGAAGAEKATGRRRTSNNGAPEKEEVVEKEATDEDPREHLNIVFIGHGVWLWGGVARDTAVLALR